MEVSIKDLTEKVLEEHNDVFADIINVLVFNGKQRVKADCLLNCQVHSQYKDEEGKLHEQERDIVKKWKDKRCSLAMFGIENQSRIDNRMSIRVYGYEGASYRGQYKKRKVVPVVTIVLNFGSRRWKRNVRLSDIVDISDLTDELLEYCNDVKINVFDIAWLSDEQLNQFTSDFGIIANFFVNKRKNRNYIPTDKRQIKHVDEVLKLLSVMSGDNRYESILADKKGVHTMCDVAQRLEDRGIAKGMKIGEKRGERRGERRGAKQGKLDIIKELIKDGAITIELGAQKLHMSTEELKKTINV